MASLEMRRESRWWYGRYRREKRTFVVNLGVEIAGTRPPTCQQKAIDEWKDVAFQKSRGKAQGELDRLTKSITEGRHAEQMAQAVYEARTGARVGSMRVDALPGWWEKYVEDNELSSGHSAQVAGVLSRFIGFIGQRHRNVVHLHEVTREIAQEYMRQEWERGVSPKTWNMALSVLRASAFGYLKEEAGLAFNPFDKIKEREVETVFRKPYTPDELKAVLQAAASDPLISPLIVTAASTAMRLGDCCNLKWADVDLVEGFITVKTAKTGATVDIPLFPRLRRELEERKRDNGSPFVFPDVHEQYQRDPNRLTDRLRRVLAEAGFRDGPLTHHRLSLSADGVEEVRQKVSAYFTSVPATPRHERMQRVFLAYIDGATVASVAESTSCPKSMVSLYLNEIETAAGVQFIRGRKREIQGLPATRGTVHDDRPRGLHQKGSVRDWHSFRTTWVTLALASGLPIELVKIVTGHHTTAIVLKHYFKPQRQELRRALQKTLPDFLTGAVSTPQDSALDLLSTATADNWQDVVAEMRQLLLGQKKAGVAAAKQEAIQ